MFQAWEKSRENSHDKIDEKPILSSLKLSHWEPTVKTETWHGANVDISEVGLDKSLNMRKVFQRKHNFRQFHQHQKQGLLQLVSYSFRCLDQTSKNEKVSFIIRISSMLDNLSKIRSVLTTYS